MEDRRESPESAAGSLGVVQVALVKIVVGAVICFAHGLKKLDLQEPAEEVRHVGCVVRHVKLGQGVELVFAPEATLTCLLNVQKICLEKSKGNIEVAMSDRRNERSHNLSPF